MPPSACWDRGVGEGRREGEKKGLVWRPLVGLPWPVVLSSQGGWKVRVLRTEVPEWASELLGPSVSVRPSSPLGHNSFPPATLDTPEAS